MEPKSAGWIESMIMEFVEGAENTLQNPQNDRAFDSPLIGFSRGDDPLYDAYKTHVGPFHWLPAEAFELAFPGLKVRADELTVISWVLPQAEANRKDNRKQSMYPADRWARARIFGEEFNVKLKKHVVESLRSEGIDAVAPPLLPEWRIDRSGRFAPASTWSERHIAHASGLGTFGLCDGLITAKGKAMRLGSVVARIVIPPTPRPYKDHHEYCLFFSKGLCGKCIDRCPVGAITEKGHDKAKCFKHLKPATADYVKANYGFDGYGCGLCQTGVPCESKIPVTVKSEQLKIR
jgi:epoxyqueuosine reductase QueG